MRLFIYIILYLLFLLFLLSLLIVSDKIIVIDIPSFFSFLGRYSTIVEIVIGISAAIISLFSLYHAKKAHQAANEISETLIHQITDFQDLAEKLFSIFLVEPKTTECSVKLAIISPAFGASQKGKIFEKYLKGFVNLGKSNIPPENVKLLFLTGNKLAKWYENSINSLEFDKRKRKKLAMNCIEALTELETVFLSLDKKIFEFATIDYIPHQIFIRRDGLTNYAMYGILGSETIRLLSKVVSKELDRKFVFKFSKGAFYALRIYLHDHEIRFDELFNNSTPIKNNEGIQHYFKVVRAGLRKYVRSL